MMSTPLSTPSREVVHGDALEWLNAREKLVDCSVVTSLPDFSEFGQFSLEEWKGWFIAAASLVMSRCPEEGVTIFYQTDIKHEGTWVDKGFLIQRAAEKEEMNLLWHKLVARVPVGMASFGKPGYSHLLCFSKGVRAEVSLSTSDILPEAGETTWTRGMGVKACRAACDFILKQTKTRTVVDPFCGHGTLLAVANSMGLKAIGVEKGAKHAGKARRLELIGDTLRLKEEPIS